MKPGLAAAMMACGLVLGSTGHAAPVPVPAAARSITLGDFELTGLRDELNVVPNDGSVFGVGQPPAAVSKLLVAAGAPADKITLSVDALLVRMPGHLVLIDTGLGPKVGGVLGGSLTAAGVTPGEITDIFITHAHPDHVGGLVMADGNLAFPNAAIRMSATEWTWMQGRPANAALVAAIRAQVKPFAPGQELLRGITAVALPGHTPGHIGYEIASSGQHLFDMGDSAHSSIVSLAEPGWTIGYDTDAAEGKAQRKATLARLAASHELVFAPHFPFPGFGRIVARGHGYAWEPATH